MERIVSDEHDLSDAQYQKYDALSLPATLNGNQSSGIVFQTSEKFGLDIFLYKLMLERLLIF